MSQVVYCIKVAEVLLVDSVDVTGCLWMSHVDRLVFFRSVEFYM